MKYNKSFMANISVKTVKVSNTTYVFEMTGVSHTIGGLITSKLIDDSDIEYVGYDIVHPLKELCQLKIIFEKSMAEVGAKNYLLDVLQDIEEEYEVFKNTFED
jgi:DNA-directed RNA polymerase subunit L